MGPATGIGSRTTIRSPETLQACRPTLAAGSFTSTRVSTSPAEHISNTSSRTFRRVKPAPTCSRRPSRSSRSASTRSVSASPRSAARARTTTASQLTSHGADLFGKLTTDNVAACPGDPNTSAAANCAQRHLAIWLDLSQNDINNWEDQAYASKVSLNYDTGCLATATPTTICPKLLVDPVTLQAILGGNAVITGGGNGGFSQQAAQDLATGITAGSLPVDLQVLSVQQVGSTLGAQSVKLSIAAGLLGLSIVVLFMIIYYRVPGLLASLALLFYAGVVFATFKVVPVTLTLAGITGFILSVGMAVDANVLIFERFKEEVRAGRTIPAAVDAAVRRAWPAIWNSNVSTI